MVSQKTHHDKVCRLAITRVKGTFSPAEFAVQRQTGEAVLNKYSFAEMKREH
jgi:hypothetical protein